MLHEPLVRSRISLDRIVELKSKLIRSANSIERLLSSAEVLLIWKQTRSILSGAYAKLSKPVVSLPQRTKFLPTRTLHIILQVDPAGSNHL